MDKWICSQFSSREKYAIPRALQQHDQLKSLYTDLWIKPHSIARFVDKSAAGRFHNELKDVNVHSFNSRFLFYKAMQKFGKQTTALDDEYDALVAQQIAKLNSKPGTNFFGYSYSSRKSFVEAKSKGYTTILGQINPGPAEAEIVINEFKKFKLDYKNFVPDDQYWKRWLEEVNHSDKIIVNSGWSKNLIVSAGVPAEKCFIVPLAYEPEVRIVKKEFSDKFDKDRPLRLLYLGGVGLRKGFHLLKASMKTLEGTPVILDVVGSLKGPRILLENLPSNIRYHGSVPPAAVIQFYQKADVFMFPTLSDGFGLTQLEAQAFGLPVITTQFCAPVITHRKNGIVLETVDADTIREAILEFVRTPDLIALLSSQRVHAEEYSLEKLYEHLLILG